MFEMALSWSLDALDVLRAASHLGGKMLGSGDRRALNAALDALRELFFFEDRVKMLLDRAAKGEPINIGNVERALEGFERSENRIEEALSSIDRLADQPHAGLNIDVYDKLRGLRGHKLDVREAVRFFLYELAEPVTSTEEQQRRIDQAQALRRMVDDVNARIRDIDAGLREIKK